MKMETLSRDSLYLKQRLNLNIDVEFVRQGGKEGHTTADRWKVDSGKSIYIRAQCTQYFISHALWMSTANQASHPLQK